MLQYPITTIERYFHVELFSVLARVVLRIKSECVTIQMRASEQYFHVVLFITLYIKVFSPLMSVGETLVSDHSNERHSAVLLCGTVYYVL